MLISSDSLITKWIDQQYPLSSLSSHFNFMVFPPWSILILPASKIAVMSKVALPVGKQQSKSAGVFLPLLISKTASTKESKLLYPYPCCPLNYPR